MTRQLTLDGAGRHARMRWLCVGMLAVITTGLAGWHVAQERSPPQVFNLMLIYVGADDCAPCRAWERGEKTTFRRSRDFAEFCYREVKSARLREILDDKHWPEDLRTYRGMLKRSDGVPLWLVVTGDGSVNRYYGVAAWSSQVLPTLRQYAHGSGRRGAVQGPSRSDTVACDKVAQHGHIVDDHLG